MTETLPAPALEHVWSLAIAVAPPLEIGLTAAGLRRVEPITGGAWLAARYLTAGFCLAEAPVSG